MWECIPFKTTTKLYWVHNQLHPHLPSPVYGASWSHIYLAHGKPNKKQQILIWIISARTDVPQICFLLQMWLMAFNFWNNPSTSQFCPYCQKDKHLPPSGAELRLQQVTHLLPSLYSWHDVHFSTVMNLFTFAKLCWSEPLILSLNMYWLLTGDPHLLLLHPELRSYCSWQLHVPGISTAADQHWSCFHLHLQRNLTHLQTLSTQPAVIENVNEKYFSVITDMVLGQGSTNFTQI